MQSETVEIGYAYRVSYVARGRRSPESGWVAATAPVSVPRIAPGDLPVAVEMERVAHPFPYYREPGADLARETFHPLDGRLSRRLPGTGAGALLAPGPAWNEGGFPYQYAKPTGQVVADPGELAPRRVDGDERAAAEAHVRALARRTALSGDDLIAPGPEPVWAVRAAHKGARTVQVMACLESDCRRDETMLAAVFRADHRERAVAYAQVLAADAGSESQGEPYAVAVLGSIAVRDPGALAFDELAWNGPPAARDAARYGGEPGFAALPIPALRAWTGFREAWDRHAAGDPDALLDALSALAEVERALPPRKTDWRNDAYALRCRVRGLSAAVPHWIEDARARAAHVDAEALASMAP